MRNEPRPTRFDAIVIGAGPAGSTVAIQLARAGWSVALIERQRFPRRKVCGECVAASNLPLLEALGVASAFDALAGLALKQVTLLRGNRAVTAALPSADHARHPWGRALGREMLDSRLLEQARAAGVVVFQPCAVQAILGAAGVWHCEVRMREPAVLRHAHRAHRQRHCEVRMREPAVLLRLRATVIVDAHGSWEDLPLDRPRRRRTRAAADLFGFKANFSHSQLLGGQISVLALDGGYGGMVVGDGGTMTLACCIRRDRLSDLRGAAPGQSAGDAVEAWLRRECAGVCQAMLGATRDAPWLSSGPLNPGVRLARSADADGIFRVGNAAGEAHPILGEGISMALQSAALLCSHLLGRHGEAAVPDAARQAKLQRAYAAAWRRRFVGRLRLAAVFAHLAMRPRAASVLMGVVQRWPGLLTHGARWGGKVRPPELAIG